jgi:hypothetical protein
MYGPALLKLVLRMIDYGRGFMLATLETLGTL